MYKKNFGIILLLLFNVQCFSLPAAPPGKEWALTFEDNFDGNIIDTAKWSIGYGWGRTANFSAAYVSNDTVMVNDGNLILEAKNIPYGNYAYRSGCINTKNKHKQKYGYWEARIKPAAGKGMWGAYWSKQNNEGWPPEIDFLETTGAQYANRAMFYVHYNLNGGTGALKKTGTNYESPGLYSQFHTYGLLWNETGCIWYIDDVQRFATSDGIDHFNNPDVADFYTMLGLQIPSAEQTWLAPPDATTLWGTDDVKMYVDYVRVYLLEDIIYSPADLNCDQFIDMKDLELLFSVWLSIDGCLSEDMCQTADLVNNDNTVNLQDFAEFASCWTNQ